MQMLGTDSWVIERKYDGEYAEIHIDLSRSKTPSECIKIFAKSGKDATKDRQGIHETLVKCLRLGTPDCQIKQKVILLGELVAWSDSTRSILPFEEIRKHVTRSGVHIGTNKDDRPADHEHLCIVFFDILLLDDTVLMTQSIEKRRSLLRSLYDKIPGRAKSAEWKVMHFQDAELSQRRLMEHFAASNAQACEGLVLKPCGLPYYTLDRDPGRRFHGYIKLKKDYIAGLGDEADFAVVGASYDAQEAAKSRLHNLHWTDFYLGTILNKEQVKRYGHRPVLRIVGSISQNHCIPQAILDTVNKLGVFSAGKYIRGQPLPHFDIEQEHLGKMDTVFTSPLVFEVLGSGFVKPSDCDSFMLRHPRVTKLHQDRSWTDCVSFDELQNMAAESRETGVVSESQENRIHLARLELTLKKKFDRQALLSPTSTKTTTTSPTTTVRTTQPSPTRTPLATVAPNIIAATTVMADSERGGVVVCRSSPRRKRPHAATDLFTPSSSRRVRQERAMVRLPAPPASSASHHIKRSSRIAESSISKALIERQRMTCINAGCFLAKAVVFLTPCIATTPYITQDLLAAHDAVRTSSWQDWVRGVDDPGSSSSVVDESQAYPGLRRIILVEGNRKAAYEDVLDRLMDSSISNSSVDDIEVWDWRVLESIRIHARATIVQHMIGVVRWNNATGRALFEALTG